MTQPSGGARLLRWFGRFLLVSVWLLVLVYGALVGWYVPICPGSYGDDPLSWSLFLLVIGSLYIWQLPLLGLAVAAVLASMPAWFARHRSRLWRWCVSSVLLVLLLCALVSWLSGERGSCHMSFI
ncbi:hypothetical protein [Dyella tabacisoli]|uniref:Uncharacterized protein n=1 Tax=Dyella tabacisoli TaxID=2282381 RepID=A0A369USD7_9GAMM|nr:hypothetical protein [Dyella tabacisoli]RDD82955.1 hypothetical protein DVJ77_05470 [Dyella tabacisoli]